MGRLFYRTYLARRDAIDRVTRREDDWEDNRRGLPTQAFNVSVHLLDMRVLDGGALAGASNSVSRAICRTLRRYHSVFPEGALIECITWSLSTDVLRRFSDR